MPWCLTAFLHDVKCIYVLLKTLLCCWFAEKCGFHQMLRQHGKACSDQIAVLHFRPAAFYECNLPTSTFLLCKTPPWLWGTSSSPNETTSCLSSAPFCATWVLFDFELFFHLSRHVLRSAWAECWGIRTERSRAEFSQRIAVASPPIQGQGSWPVSHTRAAFFSSILGFQSCEEGLHRQSYQGKLIVSDRKSVV